MPQPAVLDDNQAMLLALKQAELAGAAGEVPVGAVVVAAGRVIAAAHNRRELDADPLAHAEILALRLAARELGRWRLTGCTLFVSLEPCPMCAGAVVHARIDRLVYAASDPRTGACGSIMNIPADTRLNHRPQVEAGLLAEPSAQLLRDFFRKRRLKR